MMEAALPTTDQLDAALATPDPSDPTGEGVPTFLGIPIERILTIGRGPINIAAATLATYLEVHVHVLSLFHTTHTAVTSTITQLVIWVVTAVFTDRGLAQWVDNLIRHRRMLTDLHAAALASISAGDAAQLNAAATGDPTGDAKTSEVPPSAEEFEEAGLGGTASDAEEVVDPAAEGDHSLPDDAEEDAFPPEGGE